LQFVKFFDSFKNNLESENILKNKSKFKFIPITHSEFFSSKLFIEYKTPSENKFIKKLFFIKIELKSILKLLNGIFEKLNSSPNEKLKLKELLKDKFDKPLTEKIKSNK
jgi:hypothetical protein